MKRLTFILAIFFLLFAGNKLAAQELRFNKVFKNNSTQIFFAIQDKQGLIWMLDIQNKLVRYDGINLKAYSNDSQNINSISSGSLNSLFADSENIIWIGTDKSGLERLDPSTDSFTHFRHNEKDPTSLSSDSITFCNEDRSGNLWVGSSAGLSLFDRKTNKFKHYRHDPKDPTSVGPGMITLMYEDQKGVLWFVAAKVNFALGTYACMLNRFDRATGKFTRINQDQIGPKIKSSKEMIFELYEDKNNNFWIGTTFGLYKMDRDKISFTHYYPDPFNESILSTVPVAEKAVSWISKITEDSSGALWIALGYSGINRYDPITGKSKHFGYIYDNNKLISAKDTATGLTTNNISCFINSKDGLVWLVSNGGLFNLNYNKTTIPFYPVKWNVDAFCYEPKPNILWIGTDNGLLRKDLTTQKEKLWTHDPKNNNSLAHNTITTMHKDEKGNIWLGTSNGLDKFDPITKTFTNYQHDPKNPGSISNNTLYYLFFDHKKNLWIGSNSGISRMDPTTEQFTNYTLENKKQWEPIDVNHYGIAEDQQHGIWTISGDHAFRLNVETGKIKKYLVCPFLKAIYVDSSGMIWAGGPNGLYTFNKTKEEFELYASKQSEVYFDNVINIMEDNQNNLWVSTTSLIVKIRKDRKKVKKFTGANGIHNTNFIYNDNLKAPDGRLFLGIEKGYYSFYPDQIKDTIITPALNITGFKLGETVIKTGPGSIFTTPIGQLDELRLNHDQNVFSFDFFAADYISPGGAEYLFMLENYNNTWNNIGGDRRAYFFNVPPGTYTFRVKAVSADGGVAEKSIHIIISPPWWLTWWAYCLYALIVIISGYLIFKYQQYYIIRKHRAITQQKELEQAKEIEKAYTELKATQNQLIQSEKMASLGELTAGIAHEIQNPLNFINNFSEVNLELIEEMKTEKLKKKGERDEQLQEELLNDLALNLEKINQHGKRADAIVKGMLQHSRTSTGIKEPTNINALADEYLRLSYHGLRAKDKSFNATMKIDFDESIGNINIVAQDIGRAILNLINNAFYVVYEKKKSGVENYVPIVFVSTKKNNDIIVITVEDNGNGIPQKVLDKIFQPFFTTKPSGQGTGLGLSLSFDIVKAHGGEIQVETKEDEGTSFIIKLPV